MSQWATLKAHTTLDWRQAWKDLATLTVGHYQGDALQQLDQALSDCDIRFKANDKPGFLACVERVKALVRELSPSACLSDSMATSAATPEKCRAASTQADGPISSAASVALSLPWK